MLRALILGALVASSAVAIAQPKPDPEGARLFEQGRALAAEGKYQEACAAFEKSLELDPAIGTQLNYADCHEKLGRYAEAWRLFDSAADAEKITNPSRAKYARDRADALLAKVGVVVIKLATPEAPGLSVTIQGRTVEPSAVIREIVQPGEVTLVVSATGNSPFERSETIAAGKTLSVDVPPFVVAAAQPGGPSPSLTNGETRRRKSRVLLAYGVGGAGVATLVAGVLVGLKAKSDYDAQFDNGMCEDVSPQPVCSPAGFAAQNDAVTLANVGTVLGVAGIGLVVGGAVVFLTAPRDLVVTPTATAQSAGLAVAGRF